MRRPTEVARTALAALVIVMIACHDNPVTPAHEIVRIIISGPAVLEVGDEYQLIATAYDERAQIFAGQAFTWASTDPALVTVSATGMVKGIALGGPVRITASINKRSGSTDVTVIQGPVLALSSDSLGLASDGVLTRSLQITNAGSGVIASLSLRPIAYAAADSGWIVSATLSTSMTPATLTVVADAARAIPGEHLATMTLFALRNGRPDSSVIKVTLTVRGLTLEALSVGFDQSCGMLAMDVVCWGNTSPTPFGPASAAVSAAAPVVVASGLPFVQLALGARHRCGRTAPGELYCWGGNEFGQVGNGTTSAVSTPVRIGGTLRFRDVAAGGGYTCAVTVDYVGYCWGSQAGDGTTDQRTIPTLIAGGLQLLDVEGGSAHACGRTTAGVIYCWGWNLYGELGDGTTLSSVVPVKAVTELLFKSMVVGLHHTCGITTSSDAYCWGVGVFGQLGNWSLYTQPFPVPVRSSETFVKLTAGRYYTCGVTAGGKAVCWGDNETRQLGIGSLVGYVPYPTEVLLGLSFIELSAGNGHTCGRTAFGTFCWGDNRWNQIGDGTTTQREAPTPALRLATPP